MQTTKPIIYPTDRANIIAACLENLFTLPGFCDYGHEQHVEAQVEALLTTVVEDTCEISTLCCIKEIQTLKSGRGCGFDGIQN
jgi:hypothetical protein